MRGDGKSDLMRVLRVVLFLFVSIVIFLPYLIQISTFFHERAHQEVLDRYGVKNYYEPNLLTTIPDFFNPNAQYLGSTTFNDQQYKEMDKYQRIELHTSGIVSDLTFLFIISMLLVVLNLGVYIFYRLRMWLREDVRFVINRILVFGLAFNWVLFIWLLSLIQITIANITYPSGDIYQLVNFLR
jgi:hypothetical protein